MRRPRRKKAPLREAQGGCGRVSSTAGMRAFGSGWLFLAHRCTFVQGFAAAAATAGDPFLGPSTHCLMRQKRASARACAVRAALPAHAQRLAPQLRSSAFGAPPVKTGAAAGPRQLAPPRQYGGKCGQPAPSVRQQVATRDFSEWPPRPRHCGGQGGRRHPSKFFADYAKRALRREPEKLPCGGRSLVRARV